MHQDRGITIQGHCRGGVGENMLHVLCSTSADNVSFEDGVAYRDGGYACYTVSRYIVAYRNQSQDWRGLIGAA
jgi:hypothetical protein